MIDTSRKVDWVRLVMGSREVGFVLSTVDEHWVRFVLTGSRLASFWK